LLAEPSKRNTPGTQQPEFVSTQQGRIATLNRQPLCCCGPEGPGRPPFIGAFRCEPATGGTGCGKSARPGLRGARGVTSSPTRLPAGRGTAVARALAPVDAHGRDAHATFRRAAGRRWHGSRTIPVRPTRERCPWILMGGTPMLRERLTASLRARETKPNVGGMGYAGNPTAAVCYHSRVPAAGVSRQTNPISGRTK